MSETSSSPDRRLRAAAVLVAIALVAGCIVRFGLGADAAIGAFFCLVLVALTVTDIETRRIPNRLVLPAAVLVLCARLVAESDALQWLLAGAIAAGLLLVVALAYPHGLGMGDVKLALLLGFALGRATTTAFLIGFLAAALYSFALLLRRGASAWTTAFALGPFLALGGVVALFTT